MFEQFAEFIAKMRYYGDAIVAFVVLAAIALAIIVGVASVIWDRLKGDGS